MTAKWSPDYLDMAQARTFPASDVLPVGDCAEGQVVAKVADTNTRVVAIDYDNSLDEKGTQPVS